MNGVDCRCCYLLKISGFITSPLVDVWLLDSISNDEVQGARIAMDAKFRKDLEKGPEKWMTRATGKKRFPERSGQNHPR